MAHLEALELLSARCESDLRDSLTTSSSAILPKLKAIKDVFPADDDDSDEDDDDNDEELEPTSVVFTDNKEKMLRELIRKHTDRFQLIAATREASASVMAASAAADQLVDAIRDAHRKKEDLEEGIERDESKSGEEEEEEVNEEDVNKEVLVKTQNTSPTSSR